MEQKTIEPIVENLWWVIPGKLAGVRKPTADELSELQSVGIGAIVSVLDDPSNLDLYEQGEMPFRWLPIQGGTPPSRDQIQELASFIDEQNRQGLAVAVHCTNGLRRTGTMLAGYLIHVGSSYEAAIQTIELANSQVELRAAQTEFLRSLAGEPI
ncbi:fused DSP-PTPase phosphatase/NAD kinase-like protein [Chamaesiphon polymorphus]|uniref:Protein phosphatase n=1 Tax=Chamaesiphon polymorphus CCALA 037 TaxID=2107692 RepID=A0A2T1GEB1_9CYAN|nr:dual specificity protein phosphatase family protein [Chamaesiphon polymorphus]PSB55877.1 protein phosphatase [Chamaesiphon polymorphus CCALA 037]